MKSNTMISGFALAVVAGTSTATITDGYFLRSYMTLDVIMDSGSVNDFKGSIFAHDANGPWSGNTPGIPDALNLASTDELLQAVNVESTCPGISSEYGYSDADVTVYTYTDGDFIDDVFDTFSTELSSQIQSDSSVPCDRQFSGVSLARVAFSGDYDDSLGVIQFRVCSAIPSTLECPENTSGFNTTGKRVVSVHGITNSNSTVNDIAYAHHEISSEGGDVFDHNIPDQSTFFGFSYPASTISLDTDILVACFYDAALDLSGDGRFSQTDVDLIATLTFSDPELEDFDVDNDNNITDWDIDTFQWILDIDGGSGLLGDGDGDEDIDCDDYGLAVSQPFAGEYRGDTSGDYRIQFDADLDGDNDADDIDAVFYNFRSFNPDWSEVYGTLDVFDVDTFIAAYNAMDPSADLAAPFGTFDIFDVYAYNTMYSAGACP